MATTVAASRFLRFLEPEEENALLAAASKRSFERNEVVLDQDVPLRAIYLIEQGSVRVERQGRERSTPLAILGAGEFFGEMSVLTGAKRSATVYAVGDAVLYEITKQHIARLLDSNPRLAGIMSRTVAERQLRNLAAAVQLPPEVRAEQHKNMVEQLMRSMTKCFGRMVRAV